MEAMEGPTPVSALLHSATLVICGVLYYIKLFNFMKFSILISIVCLGLYIIVLTSYLEYDLKKIAAVTTCIAMT